MYAGQELRNLLSQGSHSPDLTLSLSHPHAFQIAYTAGFIPYVERRDARQMDGNGAETKKRL